MGMQKRLRAAQRNNFALENGKRPFSETPLGAGQVRARARLMAQRAANDLRLNAPRLTVVERIGSAAEAAAEAIGNVVDAIKTAVADATGITEAQIEKPKRVRKPKAEVVAVNEDALIKKQPRVGTRKKAAEGV